MVMQDYRCPIEGCDTYLQDVFFRSKTEYESRTTTAINPVTGIEGIVLKDKRCDKHDEMLFQDLNAPSHSFAKTGRPATVSEAKKTGEKF